MMIILQHMTEALHHEYVGEPLLCRSCLNEQIILVAVRGDLLKQYYFMCRM